MGKANNKGKSRVLELLSNERNVSGTGRRGRIDTTTFHG